MLWSFLLKVSLFICFHVSRKSFHDLKGYVPGCFWILFEVKSSTLVCIEVLPIPFCSAFGSLEVHSCLWQIVYRVVLFHLLRWSLKALFLSSIWCINFTSENENQLGLFLTWHSVIFLAEWITKFWNWFMMLSGEVSFGYSRRSFLRWVIKLDISSLNLEAFLALSML